MDGIDSDFLYSSPFGMKCRYVKGEHDFSLNSERPTLHLEESPRKIHYVEEIPVTRKSFLSLRAQPVAFPIPLHHQNEHTVDVSKVIIEFAYDLSLSPDGSAAVLVCDQSLLLLNVKDFALSNQIAHGWQRMDCPCKGDALHPE